MATCKRILKVGDLFKIGDMIIMLHHQCGMCWECMIIRSNDTDDIEKYIVVYSVDLHNIPDTDVVTLSSDI